MLQNEIFLFFFYAIATITIIVYSDGTSSPDGQRKTGTRSLPAAPASQAPLSYSSLVWGWNGNGFTGVWNGNQRPPMRATDWVSIESVCSSRKWIILRVFNPLLSLSLSLTLSFDFPPTETPGTFFSEILGRAKSLSTLKKLGKFVKQKCITLFFNFICTREIKI